MADFSSNSPSVTELVDTFIRTRRISHDEYLRLSEQVLADGTVDEQERRQINRLFDAIQGGMVKIVE